MLLPPSFLLSFAVAAILMLLVAGLAAAQNEIPFSSYLPAQLAPSFSVNLTDGTSFQYHQRNNGSERPLLGLFLANMSDPFARHMLMDKASVEAFLTVEPLPPVHIFIGTNDGSSVAVIEKVISSVLQSLSQLVQDHWSSYLHFISAYDEVVAGLMRGWPVLQRQLGLSLASRLQRTGSDVITMSRLDGHFQFCNVVEWTNHSPQPPLSPYPPTSPARLVNVGSACGSGPFPNLLGDFGFVHINDANSCAVEEMAKNVVLGMNGTGVIVMASKANNTLQQIGQNSFEQSGVWLGNSNQGFCSMVHYDPAVLALLSAPQRPLASGVQMQYTTQQAMGGIVMIDGRGRLREAGALINPSLAILGYAAQEVDYQHRVDANLTEFALTVPVFEGIVGEVASVRVAMPPSRALHAFNYLELYTTMECRGSTDLDCDKWDHVHTVAMVCDADTTSTMHASPAGGGVRGHAILSLGEANVSPNEIARYITPYRRRVGRWLTPASALFADIDSASHCNFSLAATDNGSPWVFSLSLRARNVAPREPQPRSAGAVLTSRFDPALHRPVVSIPLFNSTIYSVFDHTYNEFRTPLRVPSPPQPTSGAFISALITGHGTMEFTPSEHIFSVNGQNFSVAYMEPLDQNGCAKKVSLGVEANGHGAFEFGRDGWCNGWHVEPVVWDVSPALVAGGVNVIGYRAREYINGTWVEPQEPDGDMRLSSKLVFFTTTTPHEEEEAKQG